MRRRRVAGEIQAWQCPETPEHSFQERSMDEHWGFDFMGRCVGPGDMVTSTRAIYSIPISSIPLQWLFDIVLALG